MPRTMAVFVTALLALSAAESQAKLKLAGDPADRASFINTLSTFTGRTYSINANGELTDTGPALPPDTCACHCLADLVSAIIADNGEVVLLSLGRSSTDTAVDGVLVDRFQGNKVDLDDLEKIPPCPPGDQVGRGETIAHILGEYYYSEQHNAKYGKSHVKGGIAEQNKHREANGKTPVKSSGSVPYSEDLEITLEDGRKEVWKVRDDDIESITPPPPAEQQVIAHASAQTDTVAFWGTINSVGPAPCWWSGIHPAFIEVEYQVQTVLVGTPGATITVYHAVVEAPDTCVAPAIYSSTEPLFVQGSLVTDFNTGSVYLSLEEPVTAIPTLSEWAIIVMTVLLLSSGAWFVLRRRKLTLRV